MTARDDMTALCERLKALVVLDEVGSNNPLGEEAATAISTLTERNDALVVQAEAMREALKHLRRYVDTPSGSVASSAVMREIDSHLDAAAEKGSPT